MKKRLYFLLSILVSTLLLTNCAPTKTQENPPTPLPVLNLCNSTPLKSKLSFICLKKLKGSDFVIASIKFKHNSFTLNKQAIEILNKLYPHLTFIKNANLVIKGYAGEIKSKIITNEKLLAKHKRMLSKNRAVSVREYLIEKGLNTNNIKIKALGYQDPVAPNDSNDNRILNERVEITIKRNLLNPTDDIENHLKHVTIAHYTKFFSDLYLLDNHQINEVAEIYASTEKRPILGVNFKIFANKQYKHKSDNSKFNIISQLKPIAAHNEDKKAYKIGAAKYNHTYKGITAFTITGLNREAYLGDYIIPNDIISKPLPKKSFSVNNKITANIIENVAKTNIFSANYNSILINKGSSNGLKLGTEIILYEPEARTDGYPIPPKYIGYGFVYRQSDNYALVIIVNSFQEITKNTMAATIL